MIKLFRIVVSLFILMIFFVPSYGQENQTQIGIKMNITSSVSQGGGNYLVTALIDDETNVYDGTDIATGQNFWTKSLTLGDDCNQYQITDISCGSCSVLIGQVTVLVNDTDSQGSPTIGVGAVADTTFVGWVSGIGNDLNQCLQSFTMVQIKSQIQGGGPGGGEANTASNQGIGGVGTFLGKVGVDLEHRNINSGSSKITITDDVGSNEIDIDIDESQITITESQISDLSHFGGTFLNLTDVPSSYSGESLKAVRVNVGESALEFFTISASGEANTASNLAGDEGLFTTKSGVDLPFKSLTAGTGISLSSDANTITFSTPDDQTTQQVDVSAEGSLVGTRKEINFIQGTGATLGVIENIGQNRIDITISATGAGGGESNTSTNQGVGGVSITLPKSGVDLPKKSINAGSSKVTITDDVGQNEIDIDIDESQLIITESQISDLSHFGGTFLNLTDAPSSYTGFEGFNVGVNTTGTALEFIRLNVGVLDYAYRMETTTTAPPIAQGIAGTVEMNNANPALATEVYVNEITDPGNNVGIAYSAMTEGDLVAFVDRNDVNAYIFKLTADAFQVSDYFVMPVINTHVVGTIGDNDRILVAIQFVPVKIFIDLLDTPISYSGNSLQGVRVNVGETDLEFFTITGEANTASNLAGDEGLFTTKSGDDLPFKSLTAGTGISLSSDANAITIASDPSQIDHDQLLNFVADEHVPHSGVIFTAGTGLIGGGSIELNRTFDLDFQELTLVSVFEVADQVILYDGISGVEERIIKTDFESDLIITESQISDLTPPCDKPGSYRGFSDGWSHYH